MLKERHRRFVDAFLGPSNGNATKAAILAGVPAKGASVQAWRLLRTVKIQHAIAERVARQGKRDIANAEERDQFLTEVMRDPAVDIIHRLRAADLLNKCEGRYSMTHVLKGRMTLEDAIEAARGNP